MTVYDDDVMDGIARARGREYDRLEAEYGQLSPEELQRLREELRHIPFARFRSIFGPETSVEVAVLDKLLEHSPSGENIVTTRARI